MTAHTLNRWLTWILVSVMLVGLAISVYERRWQVAAVTGGIVALMIAPLALSRRVKVYVPPEFEILSVLFVFSALFLGEIRGYYVRFWWWDVVLHTSSGFLLGILGFLLVHILNETPRVNLHMKPGFVALFAFCFALTVGTLWEVFEYGMDSLFGFNMQKSGLVDTMWDLIVDAAGALSVSLIGYAYLKRGRGSPVFRWLTNFVENNPRLFGKHAD